MLENSILVIVGFILMIRGANLFVDGSSSVASNFKISKMIIGLTIVGFGTNTPELAISFQSMITNNPDIIFGNVFGSNIMNILLILGLGSIVSPLKIKNNTITKEIPMAMLFSAMLVVLLLDAPINGTAFNEITRSDGIIILLFFLIFIYYIIVESRKISTTKDTEHPKYSVKKSIVFITLGLGLIIGGASLVVTNASAIATTLGISKKIIAMTIVAFGTSFPEIIMTIVAAKKGEHDILIGNIIGSNVFNICVAIGLPVTIFGGITTSNFRFMDIFVFLMSSIVLYLFAKEDHKISKKEGIFLVTTFVLYYVLVILF